MTHVKLAKKGNTSVRVLPACGKNKGGKIVTFYETCIVTVTNNEIILNNGGFVTSTTTARMNQASYEDGLSFKVYRKDGEMKCDYKGKTYDFSNNTLVLKRW